MNYEKNQKIVHAVNALAKANEIISLCEKRYKEQSLFDFSSFLKGVYSDVVILHHNDLDGYVSAAVIEYGLRKFYRANVNISFIEDDYTNTLDRDFFEQHLDSFDPSNTVLAIVDISLSTSERYNNLLKLVSDGVTILHIDHHKATLDCPEYKTFSESPAVRSICGIGVSTSLLTALFVDKYLGLNLKLVEDIYLGKNLFQYVNDWDVFNNNFENTTLFKYGAESVINSSNRTVIDDNGDVLYLAITDEHGEVVEPAIPLEDVVDRFLKYGKYVYRYISSRYKSDVESYAYEITLNGYKGLALNTTSRSSIVFGEKFNEYDFVMPYTGNDKFIRASIYSNAKSKFDCNSYAKLMGGGGHKHAAGFTVKGNPEQISGISSFIK